MKQFIVFVIKEFRHILRDRRTMLILLVMPIVMIILFGYAITNEVKNSRVAILDHSKDEITKRVCQRFDENAYFTVVGEIDDISCADALFREDKIDLVVCFSENFAREITHSSSASVQLVIDGSEPNQASTRAVYAQNVITTCLNEFVAPGASSSLNIVPITHMLY
ncbi:MAG: ABC transporter permease, partial [Muribaculaceae bacterium]